MADTAGWGLGGPLKTGIQWTGPGMAPKTTNDQQRAIAKSLQQEQFLSQFGGGGGGGESGGGGGGGGGGGLAPGGFQNVTSTSTTDLPPWLKPYAQSFLKAYSNLAMPGGQFAKMPDDLNQQIADRSGLSVTAERTLMDETAPGGRLKRTANLAGRNLSSTMSGEYLNRLKPQNAYTQALDDYLPRLKPQNSYTKANAAWLDPATNPYLQATYQAAADPMVFNYQQATAPGTMAAAARAGQMGGSAYDETALMDRYGLGRNLADLGTGIYGQNYQEERGRMAEADQAERDRRAGLYQSERQNMVTADQAERDRRSQMYQSERNRMTSAQAYVPSTMTAEATPEMIRAGIGAGRQAYGQSQLDTDFANALRRTEFPYAAASGMGAALGQAGGGTGTSSSSFQVPNAFLQGSAAAPSMASGGGSGLPSWLLPALIGGSGVAGGLGSILPGLLNQFGG